MPVARHLDATFLTLCFKSFYYARSGSFFLAMALTVTTQNLFELVLSGMQCVEWNL